MTQKRQITDPQVLKALTQPLRRRLYRLLGQFGPATAGMLAKQTDHDHGQVAYHLRELARYGFIEEAPELARDQRERWWRAVSEDWGWSTLDFTEPEGRAAAETLTAQMLAESFERLRAYHQIRDVWPEAWQRSSVISYSQLRLTAEELHGLTEELNEVIRRWAEPGDAASKQSVAPDDGREAVHLSFYGFPERP